MTSSELYVKTFLKESEIEQVYVKGARIWIPDPELVWRGAELAEDYKGQVKVKIQYEDGGDSEFTIKSKDRLPHLRNPEILIGENDLTSLSYLNEPEVLYNLQVRFLERNSIYTYCGIVLVAINPYEQLHIYGNDTIQMYSGQDMGTMDPHIFAVAEEAFKRMSRFDQNQSIIVSGESGAGKTVSAKYAMRYFAMVGGSQTETQVEQKVLASNPIMESIGNAKTTRNDNSSRFGKYIEISFNKRNEIIGAHMRTYLLEKSRVVYQAPEERNYHIFYQMCASRDLPEFKKFNLLHPDEFVYTSHGEAPEIDGVDDADDLLSTREAFSLLGINQKDQMMIFQILSAVLHFGNISLTEGDGETSTIPSKDPHLSIMCLLLGIEESQMRMWLCHKKLVTAQEVLTKPLNISQATFSKDALAKHIYAQTFTWIVDKINLTLHSSTKAHKFIGVLDIYGFETFEINSFEQFCINYANEKLQQIFNMHVFKLEQEEYVREAIEWSFIDFYDNQPCIDMIESKLGILDLLDEECKMPRGSDANWCQKLYDKHLGKAKHFDKPRMSRSAFIVHHFADKVEYQTDGFLEKNRDTVLEEHINILRASEFALVAELFEDKPDPNEKKQRAGSATTHALKAAPKSGGRQNKKTVGSQQVQKATVGDQFRDSLFKLMETLNATTPHYIRCIKPNDEKESFSFDPKRAVEQLRACGVLETIRISAAGYPSRWTYPEFYQRYRVLAKHKDINRANPRKTCENILMKVIQGKETTGKGVKKEDPDKYRFGKTKIFFRAGQVAYLEKLRSDKLRACGIMIQKHVKGWLARRRYQRIIKTITLLQKYGRGLLARRHAQFLRETRAATRIQKVWKGFKVRRHYLRVRRAAIVIQSAIRGHYGRRLFQQELYEHRAILIQKMVRTWLARKKYKMVLRGIVKLQGHFRRRKAKAELKRLKIEAKSVEHIKNVNKGLENKIIQLQQKLDGAKKDNTQIKEQEVYIKQLKNECEKLRTSSEEAAKSSNKISDLQQQIKVLQEALEKEKKEKKDVISEKDKLTKEHTQVLSKMAEEKCKLKEELDDANHRLQEQENKLTDAIKSKIEDEKRLIIAEFESERSHHQRLVKEHARLQQRLENLQGEMQVLTSPQGHMRTPSDISIMSLESVTSSTSPDYKNDEDEHEEKDQGYGTKKRRAPQPPKTPVNAIAKTMSEEHQKDVDVALVLKLQNKIKDLERERNELQERLQEEEDEKKETKRGSEVISNSAFDALKRQLVNADDVQLVIKLQKRIADLELTKSKLANELDEREDEEDENMSYNITTPEYAYNNLKRQELENENDKLKREVSKLMKSIAETTDFEAKGGNLSKAGKEFMDQYDAMSDELERRREECLQLRAMLAEKSITTHAIAKQSYGGVDNIVNEDDELATAYRSEKEINRILNGQLQKLEKDSKKKEDSLKREIKELKKDNEAAQKIINQNNSIMSNLQLGPEAKIEATMQHEITRLTSENLDLRENMDKQADQIRKMKKMLKVYSKKLKDGEAAEIAAELEKDDRQVDNVASVKHKDRSYMGMLEYKKEDETVLIKNLIMDLKPKVASGLLPGLPAYVLFMCVRHTDYTNDDEKVRSLLTHTINGIKKCVKKHHTDLERVTLWLANSCRLLHTLKQYSGDKAFQSENSSRQNEHCLRNFDLSEYRQVISDLAVWIYQTMIKQMEETLQPMVVPAVLEHEAIAGLSAAKPSGMRGRSSSTTDEVRELSLDSLMKTLNKYSQVLNSHAVDPELTKQIFRQIYYFVCAGALNNLLLRKDMCNWSKGMQIRYNLSHLEQWLRDNKLQESGAQGTLEPIIQASQLLQARKTVDDVDSICEMCSKLSTPQIVKILNLYTPVDEFEERVPISFIRKIQEKLKQREDGESDNTLLMDTKYSFPVTFPFNPSSVSLDSVEVPQALHLGFLTRV